MAIKPQKKKTRQQKEEVTAKTLAEMSLRVAMEEKDPEVAADLQERAYFDMERELFSLKQERSRLQKLCDRASSSSRGKMEELLNMAEKAVSAQQTRVASFLKVRPWLSAKIREKRTAESKAISSHLDETKWREGLRLDQEKWEQEALDKLRQEQAQLEREWRQKERIRIDEQERRLIEAIADRQTKLEEQQEDPTTAKPLAWLRDQQQSIRNDMQQELARIKKDAEKRENAWREQCQQELREKESQWREQRRKELQRLEVDWREQEVLHKERAYLHQLEKEWLKEQRQSLNQLTSQWREEFMIMHREEWSKWVADQGRGWQETLKKWQAGLSAEQEKGFKEQQKQVAKFLNEMRTEQQSSLSQATSTWLDEQRKLFQREQGIRNEGWAVRMEELSRNVEKSMQGQFDSVVQSWLQKQDDRIKADIGTALNKAISEQREDAVNELKRVSQRWAKEQQASLLERETQWQKEQQSQLEKALAQGKETMSREIEQRLLTRFNAQLLASRKDLSEALEQQLGERLGSLQEAAAVIRKELLEQHQMELEIIGQELRADMKDSLNKTSADLTHSHQDAISSVSQQYEQVYRSELAEIKRQMGEQHTEEMGKEYAKWEEKSSHLQEVYEEYAIVHSKSLEEFRAETTAYLDDQVAKVLAEAASVAESRSSEQLTKLSDQFTDQYKKQLLAVSGELAKEHRLGIETMKRSLEEVILSRVKDATTESREHLDQRYESQRDKYSKQCQAELAAQRASLEEQFRLEMRKDLDRINEMVNTMATAARDQMVQEHKQHLDDFRNELYIQYRNRLGKLVEEVRQSAQPVSTTTPAIKQETHQKRR